jgi:hypothetical protein
MVKSKAGADAAKPAEPAVVASAPAAAKPAAPPPIKTAKKARTRGP